MTKFVSNSVGIEITKWNQHRISVEVVHKKESEESADNSQLSWDRRHPRVRRGPWGRRNPWARRAHGPPERVAQRRPWFPRARGAWFDADRWQGGPDRARNGRPGTSKAGARAPKMFRDRSLIGALPTALFRPNPWRR